jgi:hypothetical protein
MKIGSLTRNSSHSQLSVSMGEKMASETIQLIAKRNISTSQGSSIYVFTLLAGVSLLTLAAAVYFIWRRRPNEERHLQEESTIEAPKKMTLEDIAPYLKFLKVLYPDYTETAAYLSLLENRGIKNVKDFEALFQQLKINEGSQKFLELKSKKPVLQLEYKNAEPRFNSAFSPGLKNSILESVKKAEQEIQQVMDAYSFLFGPRAQEPPPEDLEERINRLPDFKGDFSLDRLKERALDKYLNQGNSASFWYKSKDSLASFLLKHPKADPLNWPVDKTAANYTD